jgi:hypothetical protein
MSFIKCRFDRRGQAARYNKMRSISLLDQACVLPGADPFGLTGTSGVAWTKRKMAQLLKLCNPRVHEERFYLFFHPVNFGSKDLALSE